MIRINILRSRISRIVLLVLIMLAFTVAPAGHVQAAESVVRSAVSWGQPTYPEPPAYPGGSVVPPAGVYKAPATVPTTWTAFPSYPPVPWNWEDKTNCVTESVNQWYLCAYAIGWKVSLRPAGATYTAFMFDQYTYGYLRTTGTNGSTTLTYETVQYAVISDGKHAIIIRQTIGWASVSYDYAFLW